MEPKPGALMAVDERKRLVYWDGGLGYGCPAIGRWWFGRSIDRKQVDLSWRRWKKRKKTHFECIGLWWWMMTNVPWCHSHQLLAPNHLALSFFFKNRLEQGKRVVVNDEMWHQLLAPHHLHQLFHLLWNPIQNYLTLKGICATNVRILSSNNILPSIVLK